MGETAEVIDIEELRRRRAERDGARTSAPPAFLPGWYTPVWYAWVPVWRPASPALAPPRAIAWGGR